MAFLHARNVVHRDLKPENGSNNYSMTIPYETLTLRGSRFGHRIVSAAWHVGMLNTLASSFGTDAASVRHVL